jgi:hypothetical protein
MIDLGKSKYIRKINLKCVTRYRVVNGEREDTGEVDKLVLELHLGEEPSPFAKIYYIVNVDLMYITEDEWKWIMDNYKEIIRNLENKLLNEEVKVKEGKGLFRHNSKLRLTPTTTKKIRSKIIGIPKVGVTTDKLDEVKRKFMNGKISEKTYYKYDKPLVDVKILMI